MESYRKTFRVNPEKAKLIGVCAGIADRFDLDVSLVRVGMALAVLTTFPLVLIAYFVLGALTQPGRRQARRRTASALPAPSAKVTRQRMRELDGRMQAIETYVTSSNTSLAQEIDSLR